MSTSVRGSPGCLLGHACPECLSFNDRAYYSKRHGGVVCQVCILYLYIQNMPRSSHHCIVEISQSLSFCTAQVCGHADLMSVDKLKEKSEILLQWHRPTVLSRTTFSSPQSSPELPPTLSSMFRWRSPTKSPATQKTIQDADKKCSKAKDSAAKQRLQQSLAIKCAACETEIDASAHVCDVCGDVVPGQTAVFSSSVHTTPAAEKAALEQAAAEKVAAEKATAAAGEAGGRGRGEAAACAAKVVNLAYVFA